MNQMVLLKKLDFDSLENRDPWVSKIIGLFTSVSRAQEYISNQEVKEYKGWDGEIYPKFILQTIEVVS